MTKNMLNKNMIAAIMLSCVVLTSCGQSWASGENINLAKIRSNDTAESMKQVVPKNFINVFYEGELRAGFFGGNRFALVEPGKYIILDGHSDSGMKYPISFYYVNEGIIEGNAIGGIRDPNFMRIIYDEKHQRVIWTRHESRPTGTRPPDEVIILDMELEELWRMHIPHYARPFEQLHDFLQRPDHTPFYVMDVAIAAGYYYVVSINNIRQNENINLNVPANPSSRSVTVVYKVDLDGNIIDIFRRENFEFLGIKIQDGFYVIYGIQMSRGRAETVVIYGSSESIFSEEYTVIQAKNIVHNAIIKNGVLMITGGLHRSLRENDFITLIDLNERSVIKTLDITDVVEKHGFWVHGVLYGENKDQIGMIITHGRREQTGVDSIIFVTVGADFKVENVFSVYIGEYFQSLIGNISIGETELHIVARSMYRIGEYHFRLDIIEFNISYDQLRLKE